MNDRELARFVYENSSEPIIKNPVLRKALQPRLGFYLGKSVPSKGTIEDADTKKAEDALSGVNEVMKVADLQRQGHIGHFYADGGRIPFGDGSITPVRNKSKKVSGRNLKLFEKGKLYHLRLGGDKKNLYGTKSELQKIYNKRKKAGGLQVDATSKKYKDAIPKGYGTNQDLINKSKVYKFKKNFYSF